MSIFLSTISSADLAKRLRKVRHGEGDPTKDHRLLAECAGRLERLERLEAAEAVSRAAPNPDREMSLPVSETSPKVNKSVKPKP